MLDKFIVDLLESIVDSSSCLITDKKHSNSKNKPIFGWNEEVRPFKENAMFWHSVWMSAGRPVNITLHGLMKKQGMYIITKYENARKRQIV